MQTRIYFFVFVFAFALLQMGCESSGNHTQGDIGDSFTQGNSIDLDFNISTSPIYIKWGILHGYTACTQTSCFDPVSFVDQLLPENFRTANYPNGTYDYVVNEARFTSRLGSTLTFNIQDSFDLYLNDGAYGGHFCVGTAITCLGVANKFDSFEELKASWSTFLDLLLANPPPTVNWYDVFSEPDIGFKNISSHELMELFQIASNKIAVQAPLVKIVGPSLLKYRKDELQNFLTFISAKSLKIDAVSWHEFGAPSSTVDHVNEFRGFMKTSFCKSGECPAIHINEYQPSETTLIPGEQVHWLYNLEKAKVDLSNRACWDVPIMNSSNHTETCWGGFSGMLDHSNQHRQPGYWVHKYFADLRVFDNSILFEKESVVGFTGKGNNEVLILFGAKSQAKSSQDIDFKIKLDSLPSTNNLQIEFFHIPNIGNQIQTKDFVPTPVAITVQTNSQGVIHFIVPELDPGEAGFVKVYF